MQPDIAIRASLLYQWSCIRVILLFWAGLFRLIKCRNGSWYWHGKIDCLFYTEAFERPTLVVDYIYVVSSASFKGRDWRVIKVTQRDTSSGQLIHPSRHLHSPLLCSTFHLLLSQIGTRSSPLAICLDPNALLSFLPSDHRLWSEKRDVLFIFFSKVGIECPGLQKIGRMIMLWFR